MPNDEHDNGEMVRAVQAPLQAARQDQQGGARQAAEEMGQLDRRQRQQIAQETRSLAHRRQGPGEQEDGPRHENGQREDLRGDGRAPLAEVEADAPDQGHARQDFVNGQHQRAHDQGQDVVDQPIEQQGGRQGHAVAAIAQREQHHRLEDAQAAGNMTDHSEPLPEHEDAEEAGVGNVHLVRQQHAQDGGRQQPVGRGDRDLAEETGPAKEPAPAIRQGR